MRLYIYSIYVLFYSDNIDLSFKLINEIFLIFHKKEDCNNLFSPMLLPSDSYLSI